MNQPPASPLASSMRARIAPAFVLALGTSLCMPLVGSQVGAQQPQHAPSRTFSVHAGVAPVFEQLTGSLPMFALRVDRQLGTPILLAEGSIGMQRGYHAGIAPSVIPEGQLQLQLPRRIAPYLGVGAGAISGSYIGRRFDLTTTAAIGVRLAQVIPGSILRIEARARGVGQSTPDAQLELTTGMGWAF